MDEEIRYPVCPLRNVPAAFQRFLGPDSGGFERFFPGAHAQRFDGTLLIVRLRGKKAMNGASRAIEDFNTGLARAWTLTAAGCLSFALESGNDAMRLIIRSATLLFGPRQARLPA